MNDFPYTMADVLTLTGIRYGTNKRTDRLQCPFCTSKKTAKDFGVDFESEKFHCYSCGISGRGGTQLYAYLKSITTKEAYKEICAALGVNGTEKKGQPIERPIPQNYEEITESPIASEDVINKTYSELNGMLTLSNKHKNDLLGRGFLESEITDLEYKSYVKKYSEGINPALFDIPRKLETAGCTLKGVPGFYRTREKNVWRLPVLKDSILVPYISYDKKISGYQYRKDSELLEEDENKYGWLSSKNKNDGCGIPTRIHYATDFLWDTKNNSFYPNVGVGIMVTEGAMKADGAHVMGGVPLLAVPGVSSSLPALKEELLKLKELGLKRVCLAFDMDRVVNIHVAVAIASLKEMIISIGLEVEELSWSNEIVLFNGEHIFMNTKDTFIFTPSSYRKYVEKNMIDRVFEKLKELNKTQIYFAFSNKGEINEESKALYKEVEKRCKKTNLPCEPIFWSLKLKGVDDYFAHKCRNVIYK